MNGAAFFGMCSCKGLEICVFCRILTAACAVLFLALAGLLIFQKMKGRK